MKPTIPWFILAISLLFYCEATGQPRSSFMPSDLLSQASIYQWTGENGLISNNITSSIQAKTGFIWITTYNGIMRFDGRSVDVFDRETIPFLSTDAFYRVYEDHHGTLWFASQGSGVIKYDGRTFSAIDSSTSTLPKSIRCLFIDEEKNRIWVGANNDGVFYIDNNIISHLSHTLLDGFNILDIAKHGNDLWFATDGNGVVRFNGNSFYHLTSKDGLSSNTINTVEVLPNGDVLIGSINGLNVLSKGKISSYDFLKNIPVNDIVLKKDWIWVATENGLARISEKHSEFIGEEDGQPFVRINGLSFDNEGSVWLSTGRNGLIQIKQTGIVNFTTSQGLSMNRVNIIVETKNRAFYIGSDAGDVDVYQHGEIKHIPIKTPLNNASIRDICEDDQGNLWIASYRGLLKLSKGKEKLFTQNDGLPASDLRRILKDRKGNIWFATRSGGVAKIVNDQVVAVFDKDHGLEVNYVLSLEEDTIGNIFVGTHSGGLTIISPEGKTTTHHITSNDAGILIFNLNINNDGTVWVVSNGDIYLFNGSTFRKIKLEGQNKGETFFDLIVDPQHNLWVTSNIGVLKIKSTDVENFFKGAIKSIPFKLFDNQDGMRNKECTGATRSLLSSSGKIWVPTIGGVAVFYPDKIVENKIIPPVFVTSMVTDKKIISTDSGLVAPGNLRYIFNYTALSYLSPSKVKFKYKLDNVDPDWVEAGLSRQAEYTNLKPGDYTFRVIACNNDGLWNTTGASMHFTVKPFFYQTTLFYVLLILLILSIFYITYKWRIYRVELRNAELNKLNNELDKFVYSTSHDLRAPLASILGLVNLSRIEEKNKDYYINLIEKSVKKLDEFIREIIDYSRNARLEVEPTEIDFEKLINSALEDLQYLEEKNIITKSITVNKNAPFFNDKTRIRIIVSNLLSNAIKYNNPFIPNPYLKIIVNHDAKQATITVMDNGIGISSEHLSNIFKMFYRGSDQSKGSGLGLYIVKETVEKLGGTIQVNSTINEGSTFTVSLPSLTLKK